MNKNPDFDPETQRLLDAVCAGVEVPSDEEVDATQQVQHDSFDDRVRMREQGDANIFATDGGWPGDGSGMDDLADFNQMEGWDN